MPGRAGGRAWTRWGAAAVLLGAAAIAAAVVRGRLDSDPNRVFLRADVAFKAGRHAEADAALRRLERLRPPTAGDRLLRAEVAQARDDPERALAELAAIPDSNPVAPLRGTAPGRSRSGAGGRGRPRLRSGPR